jgi:hypothetical protein
MMDWSFEMTLPSTGDEVLVEYEYLEADPSVGQTEGFDYSLSTDEGEITYALTDEDYEKITDTIQAHFDLQRQTDADEAAIARWEADNE